MTVNVGIIGCGYIGSKHAQALAKLADLRLVAVCDTDPKRVENVTTLYHQLAVSGDLGELRQYSAYTDILDDSGVDVVVVTVPSGLHGLIAAEALQHGKHVVVEKPMALSLAQARQLVDLSESTQLRLAVCHQKRFYPHLRKIREVIARGALGRLVYGEVLIVYNRTEQYYQSSSWRGTWAMDGGVLLNQAIHDIDLLLWYIGRPARVFGQIGRLLRPIQAEDTAVAVLNMPDGGFVTLAATVCSPSRRPEERITLVGTRGAFTLSGKNLEPSDWDVPDEPVPSPEEVDAFELLYTDLCLAMREPRPPFVDGKQAMTALETIFAVYQSWLKDSPVSLPIGEFATTDMQATLN